MITSLLAILSSPRFFRLWFGYGIVIFTAVALAAAWRRGTAAGLLACAVAIAFWLESATGYCRRCTHFNCGPHGWIMRRAFRRNTASLPRRRLLLHVVLDILMAVGGSALIVSAWPGMLPPVLIWIAGAAWSAAPRSPAARRDTAKWGGAAPGPRE